MKDEAAARPAARNRAKAPVRKLRQLQTENARLAGEARRARAGLDGVGLGLSATRKRVKDAEAENSELRRRLRDCRDGVA